MSRTAPRFVVLSFSLTVLALLASAASAQEGARRGRGFGRLFVIPKVALARVDEVRTELKLNDEQAKKLDALNDELSEGNRTVFEDAQGDWTKVREGMTKIAREVNAKLDEVLDDARRLGMTPSAWRDGGRGETIRYAISDSPIGALLIAATGKGICFLNFDEDETALRRRFPNATILADDGTIAPLVASALSQIERPGPHELPIDVQGTAFQERVWAELRKIPAGETRSYADIAAAVGDPKATRAVGTANGSNPVAVLVPCHRVIRSDGSLGGYAGGLDRKRKLLEAEGATWKEQAALDL